MKHYDALVLDLDGVLYLGREAVPYAVENLNRMADAGVRLTAATNNANRPAAEVAEHLRELGLRIDTADVLTSAQAAAEFLAEVLPAGSPVLAVGGTGVAENLEKVGLRVLRASSDLAHCDTVASEAKALMIGYGPLVAWFDLAAAQWAIDRGARWIATNTDPSVPLPYGRAPGNGAFVGLLERATGRHPEIIGKPGPALFEAAVRHVGSRNALVIGDRLDTDIDGANAAGLESLLVFTGVHALTDLAHQAPAAWPHLVAADLRALHSDTIVLEMTEGRVRAPGADPFVQAVVDCANAALGHPVAVSPAAPLSSVLVDTRVLREA